MHRGDVGSAWSNREARVAVAKMLAELHPEPSEDVSSLVAVGDGPGAPPGGRGSRPRQMGRSPVAATRVAEQRRRRVLPAERCVVSDVDPGPRGVTRPHSGVTNSGRSDTRKGGMKRPESLCRGTRVVPSVRVQPRLHPPECILDCRQFPDPLLAFAHAAVAPDQEGLELPARQLVLAVGFVSLENPK